MKASEIKKGKWYLVEYLITRKVVKVIDVDEESGIVYTRRGFFGLIKDEPSRCIKYEMKRVSFLTKLGF